MFEAKNKCSTVQVSLVVQRLYYFRINIQAKWTDELSHLYFFRCVMVWRKTQISVMSCPYFFYTRSGTNFVKNRLLLVSFACGNWKHSVRIIW